MSQPEELDVLVVGAGFSGVYQLIHLRKLGYKVKVVETGGGLGGIWWWTHYPGARVDNEVPCYGFSIDEIWKEYKWSERYPTRDEIIKYFNFVDEKFDLKKDIYFNTSVVSAEFDTIKNRWIVKTDKGRVFSAQFLDLCLGFGAKPFVPEFERVHEFKGIFHHSNDFPLQIGDFKDKRVAVIGTGASGVQVIQAIGPHVKHLTVFQRTPNLALPSRSYPLTNEHYQSMHEVYPKFFKQRYETFGGITCTPIAKKTFEDTPEARRAFFDRLWSAGNFEFWVGGYGDMFLDESANHEAYKFWCEKTRARINDIAKRDLLAPLVPPHYFGCKRPSLETTYYETFNQPNVDLVDSQTSPIISFTPTGLRTNNKEYEVDIVVSATGFDAVTGGMTQIEIKGIDGKSIVEKWREGIKTYLGLSSSGFPNLFFIYGPHGPTALSNGPTCLEYQGDWVVKCIDTMKKGGKERIDAKEKAEEEWSKHVNDIYNFTLFGKTESWYGGYNIPNKKREAMCYSGGIPAYVKHCNDAVQKGYEGFVIS